MSTESVRGDVLSQAAAHGGDALLMKAADEMAALRKDADRWRYVARHWFKAKQYWNNDAGNTPRALTLEIRANTVAHGAGYVESFIDEAIAAERAGAVAGPVEPTVRPPLQGGLSNAELLTAWMRKLPRVEPSERDLTAFALGVEVGRELGQAAAHIKRLVERTERARAG